MPPPHDGNEYLHFEDMIRVEKVDSMTYKSIALPYSPGGQVNDVRRAFGGHVYAQSAWAACQTVDDGYLLYVREFAMALLWLELLSPAHTRLILTANRTV